MTDFSATDVAFTGIRFSRGHPRTLAIWAGIQIVISIFIGVLTVVMFSPFVAQMQSLNAAGPSEDFPQVMAQVMAAAARLTPFWSLMIVLSVAFYAVLYATMARAVLEPEHEGVGYIRFGMDEVRQGLLYLLWIVVLLAAEIVAGMIVAIPVGVVLLTARHYTVLAMIVSCVLVFCAGLYVAVRLSLSSPLTFDTRRVNLFGSWALTRGRFWSMLGAYLLMLGIAILIGIVMLIVMAVVGGVLGGVTGMALVFKHQDMPSIGSFFQPARLAVTVIGAVVTPVFWAVWYMPAMEIYRQLTQRPDATFD